MKFTFKITLITLLLSLNYSCESDDGSSTTGNTQEYFKYSIDGATSRIFDNEVEAHLETYGNTIIDKYEINASGISTTTGNSRRISAVFSFDSNGVFMPNTAYQWGLVTDNTPNAKFYFGENTASNLFILTADFATHPITANVTSPIPNNIGDYIEFTFSGSYQDENNITHNITGECRVQRDIDQVFP